MPSLEQCLKDQNIINIANNSAKSFRRQLSDDEIKNCIMHAIWKALRKFDETHGAKFTSYLHKGVYFECIGAIKNLKLKSTKRNKERYTNPSVQFETIDMINSLCIYPSIIIDKYYKNLSIREIAKTCNVSKETVRLRIKNDLQILKRHLEKSV